MVLAGAQKVPTRKSDVIYWATTALPQQYSYFTLSLTLDSLVTRGLVEVTKDWMYRITDEGFKVLKGQYQTLQNIMLTLHTRVNG